MNTFLLVVLAASAVAVTIFLIPLLIELKRTIVSVRKTLECNVGPALDEMRVVLKNAQDISANVNEVTEEVKELSKSIGNIGRTVGTVNALVGKTGASAAVTFISLRTGIMAALTYFIRNLIRKGETS